MSNPKKFLIEISEEKMEELVKTKTITTQDYALVAEVTGNKDAEVSQLYRLRAEKLKELGEINNKLNKIWENR